MLITLFKINNHKYKNFLVFLFVSYIVFFNLALGPVSRISGSLWMYLWDNISWFSFFRSFSRFLIIIIPIYLFYFAVLYLDWKFKFKNYILTIFIIIIFLLNTAMFTGNLGGTILATQIPQEYKKVNIVLDKDKTLNSIISYPNINYEAYYWGINKNTYFIQQDYILKDYLFNKPIAYNRDSLSLNTKNNAYKKIFNNNPDPDLKRTLEEMNLRYVIVNKDEIDIFSLSPIFSENFREYFLKNSKLVESNKYYDLFDIGLSTPHIYNSYFKKINPTKYNLYIENLSSSQDLIFLESFHKNWNLYLKANPSNGWCKEIRYYAYNKANECEHSQTFFQGEELSYLWEKPVFDDKHTIANEYANKWAIDPDYIKSNYPPEYYKENPDGSIDVEMVLYFKPQSYFYLGIIISTLTFVGCIGYLTWGWWRNRNYTGRRK
ncbi:MAG: hypothetical protein FIB07_17490 [Candidatus Methanoperedens sp.]|nr:hypothetical protein [Candidatus Methanoperedens sp.]